MRRDLLALRREHVEAQDARIRALLFKRPPAAVMDLVPDGAAIGLYRENTTEAPASAYARFFSEAGYAVALPRFDSETSPMEFARFEDPFAESGLEIGPFGIEQPEANAPTMRPDVLFVPLVGFTANGARLGQGGGHYDRWLADNPDTKAIGLAWDVQLRDELPMEEHDRRLDAVITPTRLFGPFA
ncbi:5-formyltetrahydrofolate cyclo-ligase [Alteriqipengyuania flavescens]|uniref:5-formyltetrahydrofolate cyclo-ligase n=1 Tax=Alteriqipengyuania flavescens TaxID=3053610 RepID=UPI0025B520D1|nr:5-formyltetrahydrofolate cyclo-ligase [Alteriqipengyuania flavescens]WJY18433.1 5-formyltetrahydrofolate cyclo-ligase [Alteriqipengyuania flavescens]WJY24374.1 5-formyltetrahydrofolate cyclo-ligase [Alteriqipengyuania flavescens]